MKKILVYYLYSLDNAGDMAICLGALDLLSDLDDVEITMISRYTKRDPKFIESKQFLEKYHPNVVVKPGYIPFNRQGNFLAKVFSYLYGGLISCFPFLVRRIKKDVVDADLVLFNGGNYLRCDSFVDSSRLKALFLPLKTARRHNKKIICLPQSSNFTKSSKKLLKLKRYCSLFDYAFLREEKSYDFLVSNGIFSNSNCCLSCDLAFFTKDRFKGEVTDNIDNNDVALNVRTTGIGDIGSVDPEKVSMVKDTYKKMIFSHPDHFFTFVCQTKKDFPTMKDLFNDLKAQGAKNVGFVSSFDAYELKNIYKHSNLLISMRLHASILAISSSITVIGFTFPEWGFKNSGILKQFDMINCENGECLLKEFDLIANHNARLESSSIKISNNKEIILKKIKEYI